MKLSAYSIIILGLAIAAVVLSFGYFHFWVPNTTEAGYYKEQAAAQDVEIQKSKKAVERYEDAVKLRDAQVAAWQKYVRENTPPDTVAAGGVNLAVDPWQLAIDARKYRNNAQRALNAQLRKGGVVVVEGPEIPWPDPNSTGLLASYFNLPPFNYPIVIWELGTVRVRGTYKQIMDHVRAWSRMKGYLAVTDGLQIDGTSPQLSASYSLVVVGYLKGKDFFGGVNEGAVAASGGGSGPGAGGPRGGGPMAAGPVGGPSGGKGMGAPPMAAPPVGQ